MICDKNTWRYRRWQATDADKPIERLPIYHVKRYRACFMVCNGNSVIETYYMRNVAKIRRLQLRKEYAQTNLGLGSN